MMAVVGTSIIKIQLLLHQQLLLLLLLPVVVTVVWSSSRIHHNSCNVVHSYVVRLLPSRQQQLQSLGFVKVVAPVGTSVVTVVPIGTLTTITTKKNHHPLKRSRLYGSDSNHNDSIENAEDRSSLLVESSSSVSPSNVDDNNINSNKQQHSPPSSLSPSNRWNSKAMLQQQQQQLLDWAKSSMVNIQISSMMQLQTSASDDKKKKASESSSSGYGWYYSKNNNQEQNKRGGEILLSVPSSMAIVVESSSTTTPTRTNSNTVEQEQLQPVELPWFVNMAAQLCQLNTTNKNNIDYQPWLQSLPRTFDTPFHWQQKDLSLLQYTHLQTMVQRQRDEWQMYYNTYLQQQVMTNDDVTTTTTTPVVFTSFEEFVWACECARSRAFAGSYSGSGYNPNIYLFTLLLITVYVGGNFGTFEQAANGAGLIMAVSILRDFVLPKFFHVKRYVICPMIDMTNHNSMLAQGEVAYEYFTNSYSLSIKTNDDAAAAAVATATTADTPQQQQLYISYGPRSNDQLLQYYGFVELNNPHDVYVMPPIREWDIVALEKACGRTFQPGRLKVLEAAGLLGGGNSRVINDDDNDQGTAVDGVVLSRSIGLDPAILQALRVLVSSEEEWDMAQRSINNFSTEQPTTNGSSGSSKNEQCVRLVAVKALEMELTSKSTTLDEDMAILQRMDSSSTTTKRWMVDDDDKHTTEERLAIQFRIEKKRLLQEIIQQLKTQSTTTAVI